MTKTAFTRCRNNLKTVRNLTETSRCPVLLVFDCLVLILGPLHEQTQTGLSFRSARVSFRCLVKALRVLIHEKRRNETRAGFVSVFQTDLKTQVDLKFSCKQNFFQIGAK